MFSSESVAKRVVLTLRCERQYLVATNCRVTPFFAYSIWARASSSKLLASQCTSLQDPSLEFPKRHETLHVFHPININRSIQMIDFVLEDSRLESLHMYRLLFPMSIKVGNGNLLVSGNETARVGET
jgi:hypothetical protein